jgi:hypothetical protein
MSSDEHPGYMTVKDVARIYKTSVSNVYRLASLHQWRRYRLDGRIRYHADDVEHTMQPELTTP